MTTCKDRILAHRDKFSTEQQEYLDSLTEDQAKCIVSYWDDPIHNPSIKGVNQYGRTFKFLGLNREDPIVPILFGDDMK